MSIQNLSNKMYTLSTEMSDSIIQVSTGINNISNKLSNETKIYTCPTCGLTFSTQELLDAHIQIAHPKPEKVLVYAWTIDYRGLTTLARGGAAMHNTYQAYDTLVRYDSDLYEKTGQHSMMPWLATSWETSSDGLVWTFHLREGHHFYSSDNVVDANAVKFSFERVWALQKQGIGSGAEYVTEMIESIEVVDDYTIQFTLLYPFAPFLSYMVDPSTCIVDPAIMKYAQGDDYGQGYLEAGFPTMGSGPFILQSWTPGEGAIFIANKNHFNPPKIDKVIVQYVAEPTTQLMMLKRGDVDAAHNLAFDQMLTLKDDPNIIISPVLTNWLFNLWAPCCWIPTEPTANEMVRMAIRYALDYDEIIKLTQGYGLIQQNPISKGLIGHDPSLSYVYHRDLTKARELLAEAGYANGFSVSLNYEIATKCGVAYEDVCLLIKDQLAEIGIECELRGYGPGTFWGVLLQDTDPDTPGNQHAMRGLCVSRDGTNNPDANGMVTRPYDWNDLQVSGYQNERIPELIEAQKVEVDPVKRQEYLNELATIYMTEDPKMYLFQGSELFAYNKRLTHVVYNTFIYGLDFQFVDIQ